MRIIYLYQYFTTPQMSGGTFAYEMARRLVRYGHQVHMVTSDRSTDKGGWYYTEEEGIQVSWCRIPYSNHMKYGRRMQAFARFAWAAGQKAASLKGDVIYACSPPLTTAVPGVYAARKNSIPMVFEVADRWPDVAVAVGALKHRPVIRAAEWLERFAYRHAAHVIAMSPDMKAGVVSTGYPADRVTVIPNGCDPQRFHVPAETGREFRSRYEWLGDRPLVVYTGTLGLVNGLSYLARVAQAVARLDPDVRFLLVGGGREEELVRSTAERLGVLGRNFFMLPAMPKSEIPAVLSAADIATSTVIDRQPLWANSANKVFDAMAAARPIAINHEGWLADLIRLYECGLVLPPHDYEAAAGQLIGALRDPAWLAAAGAHSFRVGEEQFDRDDLARKMESVFMVAASRGRTHMAA